MPELQSIHIGTVDNRGLNVLRLSLVLVSFAWHGKLVKEWSEHRTENVRRATVRCWNQAAWLNVSHKHGIDCAAAMCAPAIAPSIGSKETSASASWEPSPSWPVMVRITGKKRR